MSENFTKEKRYELAKEIIEQARNSYPNFALENHIKYIQVKCNSEDDDPDDINWDMRNAIVSILTGNLHSQDCKLLHYLLEQDLIAYQKCGFHISLFVYDIAEMIYLIGNVEDIKFLWKIKNSQFDLLIMLSAEYFVGAGIDKTIDYVKALDDFPEKEEMLDWLTAEIKRWVRKTDEKYRADLNEKYTFSSTNKDS